MMELYGYKPVSITEILKIAALFVTAIDYVVAAEHINCNARKFDSDSFVCVCNSTYCDTVPKIETIPHGQYVSITSTSDRLRFNVSGGEFQANRTEGIPGLTLHVDSTVQYQTIFGFGGAFTDSAGINILSLSEATQDNLLKSYFSKDGIEYTYGRVPIGGTDFSTHPYTYADQDEDATFKNFTLADEDFKYKIPLIKRAETYAGKPLNLVGSCWSPPIWMKTNHNYNGFGVLKQEYYRAYADYHIKFLDKYEENDIKFWSITTGNEPINGLNIFNRINSLGWTPISQRQWIGDHLGPMLNSSKHNDVLILAIDDQRIFLPWWLDAVFEYKKAKRYIKGVAVHWYLDFIIPSIVLDNTHKKYPELIIINTESCYGDKPWDFKKVSLGAWYRAESYAHHIIEDFNNWVGGWIDWNLALNQYGGPNWIKNYVEAPIIVNEEADEFYKQPIYYGLGHFSKFITNNSVRIKITGPIIGLIETLAVKRPDNIVVLVILNKKHFDVPITIKDDRRGSTILRLPKKSITTVMYV